MLLLAVPLGLLIGLTLGSLGGGGSILTVPVLVYMLGQNPHGATTASLLVVGLTAVVGAAAHLGSGRLNLRLGLLFGLLGVGGSYIGSRLSARVDPNVLLAAFSVLIAGAAVTMLKRAGRPLSTAESSVDGAPVPPRGRRVASSAGSLRIGLDAGRGLCTSPIRLVVAASAVGLLTGFFGVGGGFVVVPALVLGLGMDMTAAVGTSLVVIAVNSGSGLLSRIGTHPHVDLSLVVIFTAAAMVGTLGGSRVVSVCRPERLVRSFAVLLLAVSAYTALRSAPHLI